MMTAAPYDTACELRIDVGAGRCVWTVASEGRDLMRGEAADAAAARHEAGLAAGLLDAFHRIGRRRF